MRQYTESGPLPEADIEFVGPVLRIDGAEPISAELVARVGRFCELAESLDDARPVVVWATGVPTAAAASGGLTVATVSRWERVLRRLERVPVAILAVAVGDCGGPALDALLTADFRVVSVGARLILPTEARAAWPGMAAYRLARYGAQAGAIRRAVLLGAPVEARDALALGLADTVGDDVAEAVCAAAEQVAAIPGAELAIRRQLLFDAPSTSFEDALGVHLAACDRALRQACGTVAP